MSWQVNILTLFPEIFPGPLSVSLLGKALDRDIWKLNVKNIREYAKDKHGTVDDKPYGGGNGMLIKADVLGDAIEGFFTNSDPIYYLSPRGKVFNQEVAFELTQKSNFNILCGRFEGIDERVIDEYNVQQLSLGDFVLSSGDIAALAMLDSCLRLLPGVIENSEALSEESFNNHQQFGKLLEYPQYTRPNEWKGRVVPSLLLSGNHKEVAEWRLKEALRITQEHRPDLLKQDKI